MKKHFCKTKEKECLAYLSFEYISKAKPICDIGYNISFDENNMPIADNKCQGIITDINKLKEIKKGK